MTLGGLTLACRAEHHLDAMPSPDPAARRQLRPEQREVVLGEAEVHVDGVLHGARRVRGREDPGAGELPGQRVMSAGAAALVLF